MGSEINPSKLIGQAEVTRLSKQEPNFYKIPCPPFKIKQAQGCRDYSDRQDEWLPICKNYRLHPVVLPASGKGRHLYQSAPTHRNPQTL